MLNLLKKYSVYIGSFIVFSIFMYIGLKTPLAGDDWAFANNANSMGVFESAMSMFYGWEGRLMTLFSIHFLIQYKILWVIINALLYSIMFFLIIRSFKIKNTLVLISIVLCVMFSIKDNIRMEVYSWITGSVYYGIPMFISFVYFYNLFNVLAKKQAGKLNYIIGIITAFYLPLGMENISISILIVSIIIFVVIYIQEKKINKNLIVYMSSMIIGFIIWSMSPGSSIRLATMPEWTQLSLIGKVFRNLPSVLYFSFFENKEIIVLLSVFVSINLLRYRKSKLMYLSILINGLSIMIVASPSILARIPNLTILSDFADGYSLLNQVFWIIYTLNLGVVLYFLSFEYIKDKRIFFAFLIGFFASAALFMSPVIGYRLMIYPVYYLMFVIVALADNLEYKKSVTIVISLVLILLTSSNVRTLFIKYQSVENITRERNLILEDYALYADQYESGIWLPRYPIYSIHGGDIEFEDTYHMKAFKEYFNIPQEEIITFYWKDKY